MITTSDNYLIEAGSKQVFAGASLYSIPEVLDNDSLVRVSIKVLNETSAIETGILALFTLEFTFSEILAFTASGSDEIAKFYNQVEQAVKDYMENISGNGGATFTIS